MPLLTFPWPQILSAGGSTYPGAKLFFYETGTSTLATTYSDAGLTTPHTNPVVADATGVFPPIYLANKRYKAVLKTAGDVTLFSADPVTGSGDNTVATIADMTAIDSPTNGTTVQVSDLNRGGYFVFDTTSTSAADNGITFKADDATSGSWVRQYSGPASAAWFGAVGDGTDQTTALQNAINAGLPWLQIPAGTYVTTGLVIGADSGIGKLEGVGFPEIKRQGAISGSANDVLLAVYSNRIHITGIRFNGLGATINPPDATLYADVALNSNVGNATNTAPHDNLNVITDCYFYDAPGSCIAGAGMQSAIIQACKFEEWRDHAVYVSGDGGEGQGLGGSVVVDGNIFWMTGTTSNGAVKCRNNVSKYVVSDNVFDIGDEVAIDIHGGGGTTDFVPLSVNVTGNVGQCGIFARVFSNQNSTQDGAAHFVFANNNMRCSDRGFYLGDTSSTQFAGDLVIQGGSYANTSGSFKAFIDGRFFDNTNSHTSVSMHGVKVSDFAVMQGMFPKTLVIADCDFDRTYAAWFLYTAEDDAIEKKVVVENCRFTNPASGQGRCDFTVNDSSRLIIRGNYFESSNAACRLRDFPELVIFEGNTCIDTSGIDFASTVTARASANGTMILRNNKMISTAGASVVPRLISENTASGSTVLLDNYTVYAIGNFFKNVTGALYCVGTGVTGYSGSAILYTNGNHGSGSTIDVQYPAPNKTSTLPSLDV